MKVDWLRLLFSGCCLLLLLFLAPACQLPGGDGRLTVVFPLETTELTGGQSLRVTLSLQDDAGQPVEGATAQAELYTPNGDVFATLACADKGQGRYLADTVHLPLRGAEGVWRVVAQAAWGDGEHAQAERAFKSQPSFSEEIQREYGFWIQVPNLFNCHENDQTFKQWRRDDGSGYVLLENHCHGGANSTVSLDVHWQHASMPANENAAIAHVRSLAVSVYHDPNNPGTDLVAESVTSQGQTTSTGHYVWRVTGQWKSTYDSAGAIYGGPVEWLILECPGSNWLWTLAISTNEAPFMDDLRALRETFECPSP